MYSNTFAHRITHSYFGNTLLHTESPHSPCIAICKAISGPGSTARLLADVHGAAHIRNAIPAVEAAASESHTRSAPLVDGEEPVGQSTKNMNDIAVVLPSTTHFRTRMHCSLLNTLSDGQLTVHLSPMPPSSICFFKAAFMSVGLPLQPVSCVAPYRTRKNHHHDMEWVDPTND